MLTEETRNLLTDDGVVSYVGAFGKPALDQIWLAAFIRALPQALSDCRVFGVHRLETMQILQILRIFCREPDNCM